ncbi:MAG: menaquinone biosynthetic enzyme MqnA/MqnD family protein [Thermoanaerobaculia bacterium]
MSQAPIIRVSLIDYVNTWPLTWGFLRGAVERIELLHDTPAACAARLARGEVDAGLIPAVEAARIPGVRLVRGVGIAARARVRSVLLVSPHPLGSGGVRLRTVALDASSRSSATMVRILLRELFGLEPEYHEAVPDLSEMLRHHDAALLIGDPALTADLSGLHVLDLAEGWRRLTGLPFVFAVWAVRPSVLPEPFLWSRDFAARRLEEVLDAAVVRTGLKREVLSEYLTRDLHHDLDAEDEKGLAEFYGRAFRHGLIPSPEVPPFSSVPLVPRREI